MPCAFFRELLPLLRTAADADGLTPERVCEILATHYGGTRPHIGKRWQQPEISPRDTPATVQRKYGVPRSTAHNWVQRWKR